MLAQIALKVAVLGARGCIGGAAVAALQAREVGVIRCSSKPAAGESLYVDLANEKSWENLPRQLDAVLICAGSGNLRECLLKPDQTAVVNVTGTAGLVNRLHQSQVFTVVLSTNYVFDASRPDFAPQDHVSPLCEYGRQKVKMERAIAPSLSDGFAAVVRLTKVLGGQNKLLKSWLSRLQQHQTVEAANDARSAFLPSQFVGESLASIVMSKAAGCWHLSATDDFSWLDVATAACDMLGASRQLVVGRRLIDLDHEIEFVAKHGTMAPAWPGRIGPPSSMLAVRGALESMCRHT